MPADEGGPPQGPDESPPPEKPDYKVYRSRRGLGGGGGGVGKPDLSKLRGKTSGRGPIFSRKPKDPAVPGGPEPERSTGRKIAKWALIGAGVWILLSFVAFAISSQIQSGKLADDVGDELSSNPLLLFSGQTILVLGTDARPPGLASESETADEKCIEAASRGETAPEGCIASRADTILLIRAGGTSFNKLSIPRDTVAAIPGHDPQEINGAYAFGGAKLMVQTVEDFLGIDVDHVAIVDFQGFRDFIDAIGGISVELDTDVCVDISGGEEAGGFSLDLKKGESELNGDEALTLARTRSNTCGNPEEDQFTGTDLERAKFQQVVLSGIKGRLTDPLRLPYNFIKGPIIGWNAPKAFVSDMGALIMPQLIFSAAIGGDAETDVLTPESLDPLVVPQAECVRAVEKFLGEKGPKQPACSPGG